MLNNNYITVHLPDGRKITKERDKLLFFRNEFVSFRINNAGRFEEVDDFKVVQEGHITINLRHAIDIRPAEEDEIKHAENHGW